VSGSINDGEAAAQDSTKKVLLLNSYHPGYAWSDGVQASIVETVRARNPNWLPHIEYLDCKRFPGGEHLEELACLLSRKYEDLSLVIAMDNPALEFALKNRSRLFEHPPILFCGINDFTPAMLHGHSNVTGRAENTDIGGTIDVMLRLHPAAREVFVIHDYTVTGLATRNEVEDAILRFPFGVRFRFMENLNMEDVLKGLERLPGDCLVLVTAFTTDKSGRAYGVPESTSLFVKHSPVPVYSAFESRLGHGIVGGKLTSPKNHGARTALMALRILGGEKPSDIPVETESDTQLMFDYASMSRFDIPMSALPEKSVVINRPVSFYAGHRAVIHYSLSAIAILSAIIALLTITIVQKRRAISALSMSEERFRLAFENANDGVCLVANDGRLIKVNKRMCDIFGYSGEELQGMTVNDLAHPEDLDKSPEFMQQSRKGELQSAVFEKRYFHKDGHLIYGRVSTSAIRDTKDAVLCFISHVQDISERKQAEEALRASEARFRGLAELLPQVVYETDTEGVLTYVNRRAFEIYGYTEEDFRKGLNVLQTVVPEDRARAASNFRSVLTGDPSDIGHEYRSLRKDGTSFPVVIYSSPIIREGTVAGTRGILIDITARKQAEEALRRSEQEVRLTLDATTEGIWKWNLQDNELFFSTRYCKMLGYEPDELPKSMETWKSLIHPDDLAPALAVAEEYTKSNSSIYENSFRLRTKSGEYRWIHSTGRVVERDARGQPIRIIGQHTDITERKHAEDELKRSQGRFRFLIENAPDAIFVRTEDRFSFVNPAMLNLLGVPSADQLIGQRVLDRVHPDGRAAAAERMKQIDSMSKPGLLKTQKYLRMDGTPVDVEVFPVPLMYEGRKAALVFMRDITERKRAEEEQVRMHALLQQAQKMEAIGTLAGGIAHDFNNILSVILGNAEMAMPDIPESSPARYSLDQVVKAGNRAKDLVGQILAFSRKTERERKPIRVGTIAKEVLKFLRASFPSTIEISRRMDAERDTVLADPTQIHQVLMNLCANAHHAMLENGGVLELELSNMPATAENAAEHPDLQPGWYLKLGLSDTGCGMSTEVMKRIFEPYFTTKEKGTGTGLGLAVVHGIINDLGGAIRVQSEPGKGSRFEVFLPLVDQKAISGIRTYEELPRGRERILFVDDEEGVVDMGKRMLQHLGYEVEGRTCSMEALAAFRSKPEKFDLVITDVTMPNMTGERLAKEVIGIRSDIPVIICTGYSDRISDKRATELGVKAFIMKPILMRDMAAAIRQTLEKKQD
jgi:PAS domain S-box-containing protein